MNLSEILSGTAHDLAWRARCAIESRGRAVLETTSSIFDWEAFSRAGLAEMSPRPGAELVHNWHDGIHTHLQTAWTDLVWNGESFEVIALSWDSAFGSMKRTWVLASSLERARDLFEAVCRFCTRNVEREILVFEDGYFQKSARLYAAIESARLTDLVLSDEMLARLRDDFTGFFAAKDVYARYGLAHKRGALFLGPPGNGKTHAIKALVRESGKPCLYVKSIIAGCSTDHANVRDIFERARETAPCILVLEDIDALVTNDNRAIFLNELDGFASNDGLLVVGTTNHPERLDPALSNRPSRFDRKYVFELPDVAARTDFFRRWNKGEHAIAEDLAHRLAEMTRGFSFAHLKETCTSALLRWINTKSDFRTLLEEEARALALQVQAS